MEYKIKTSQDYKKTIYKYFKSQENFARFLHQFHPEGNFRTLSRTVQKKANGETGLTNNDILVLNLAMALISRK